VVVASVSIAWAAKGDWSAAIRKVDELKSRQIELRRLIPKEVRRIVAIACGEADEDDLARTSVNAAAVTAFCSVGKFHSHRAS
jgi:hypothetical protein